MAREHYGLISNLPIVSPHGHVEPRLLADEYATFGIPADLFIIPDHYVFRMLYSRGVPMEASVAEIAKIADWTTYKEGRT
jgi:glucuronate isomerase